MVHRFTGCMARAASVCFMAAMACAGAQAAGQAAPSYRLDMIPKQHGVTPVTATAINNLGVVVGSAHGRHHSAAGCFKYEQGKVTLMQDSQQSFCYEINDAGEVAGMTAPGGEFLAAMWTAAGELQVIGPAGSQGFAINSEHQVVGYVTVDGFQHAALFANGSVTDFHSLGLASVAESINSDGKVVGYFVDSNRHAFAWQSGVMREICKIDGARETYTYSVNHKGQVLCAAIMLAGGDLAFIEDEDGTQHPIPGVHGHGLLPYHMNNFDQNVGRGFPHLVPYYSTGTKTYDLMHLVTVNAGGWTKLQAASDINRSGQIVGWGRSSSGPQRAYIATPLTAR